MTNPERINKGIRTSEPNVQAGSHPLSICTDSDCSSSVFLFGGENNEEALDTKRIVEEQTTTLPEVEISSSTGNEDNFYKMKANVQLNFTPKKIEFERVKNKAHKCLCLTPSKEKSSKASKHQKNKQIVESPRQPYESLDSSTFLSRLKRSFAKMRENTIFIENANARLSPRKRDPEKIDIYYFDHGNAAYFRTTDSPPTILSEMLAQQTTYYATRFWAEIFGSLHIGVTFFITFFLQTYRFILYSIIRAVIVGFFQMTSDYLIKPILTVAFNGAIQPLFILVYNILSSVKDMLEPVADTITILLKPAASLLASLRLVSINKRIVIHKDSTGEHANCEDVQDA